MPFDPFGSLRFVILGLAPIKSFPKRVMPRIHQHFVSTAYRSRTIDKKVPQHREIFDRSVKRNASMKDRVPRPLLQGNVAGQEVATRVVRHRFFLDNLDFVLFTLNAKH